jgi:sensor c-di-GMP phosphodiesterase-like protein
MITLVDRSKKDPRMRSTVSRSTVLPLAVAAAAFGIGAVAIWLIACLQINRVLSEQKHYIVQRVSQDLHQRDELLEEFADLKNPDCSDRSLETMRRTLFEYYALRDTVVLGAGTDEILCTALLGRLDPPVRLPPEDSLPTPRQDRRVWIGFNGLNYPGSATSVLFREGEFGVLSYPTWPGDLPGHRTWEMTATTPDGGSTVTTFGRAGTSDKYLRSRWNPLVTLLNVRDCTLEDGIVCLYLSAGPGELVASEWPLMTTGLLVNATVAALLFLQFRTHLQHRGSPGGRIRRAIRSAGGGIRCVYQPIIDLRTGRLSGCEVLARFEDEFGPLSPDEFIPQVERQKLTWAFTEIVLARALDDLEPVHESHPGLGVSVNFFPGDLDDAHLDKLRTSKPLRRAARRKVRLCFEILETGIHAADRMREIRRFLNQCGFLVAIDDFGTGYSNISQVRDSHIDLIKIDRSFVQELDRTLPAMRGSLVGPMIEIARSIGVDVVAEGIETEAQLARIRDLEVRYGQGFFLSRPLEAAEFVDFARADRDNAQGTVVSMTCS